MTEFKLMLAQNYINQNVIDWWMSEKLDGIRAFWDGEKFISRTGKDILAPNSFLKKMPKNIRLDGELCAGRGEFSKTCSIVKKTKDVEKYTDDWINNITYHVFDIFTFESINFPFEKRMKLLDENVDTKNGYISIIKQTKIKSIEQMEKELDFIINSNGEGLMLRQPNSIYEQKRSKTLLKVKKFHDMEVKIIGYKNGTGKYKNKVGSFDCITKNGNTFNCGSGLTDEDRDNPPKINSFITVKYFELSKDGIPRFPVFLRIAERQEF